MPHVECHAPVAASAERVWQVLGDLAAWPRWCPTITRLDLLDAQAPGPRTRAYLEQPGLRPAVWTMQRWQPPLGFAWESRHPGIRVVGDHRIRPTPEGAEVTLALTFSGWLATLLAPWLRRVARQAMTQELAALRQACEATSDVGRPAP